MLTYFLQFDILLTAWMLAQCQGCSTGWFGKNCEFLCHCLNFRKCDIKGNCPGKGRCEKGFFGPGCQYVDVLQTDTSVGLDQALRDGDDTTCNPQTDAKVLSVSLADPVPFTWFRLALKNKKNMLNFNTTLNDEQACRNERKFPVNDTLVDVICERDTMTSLKISGPAVGSLCSIYISGGRNVALKQATNQSSDNYVIISGAENAVDGDSNNDFSMGHCTHTDNEPLPVWWSLTFSEPQILYKAVIYNRGMGFEDRLTQFHFETFDKDNKAIFMYRKSYPTALLKYEFNIYNKLPVTSLKLTKTDVPDEPDDRVLTLCEVETFGDHECPLGTYGFYCEKCACNVTSPCHPFSGVCAVGCQPGFYGFDCSSRCWHCLHDVCAFHTGECLQCAPGYMGAKCDTACSPGTYGSNCRFKCSKRCTNVCDSKTGNCSCQTGFAGALCADCAETWHGPNCEKRCSGFCQDMLCDKLTGKCRKCPGNRVGNFCRDCPVKYYGALCTSKCNTHCLNGTCDQMSGKCVACEEGYEGSLCFEKKPSIYLYLAPFLPLYLLFVACILACSERIQDEEEVEEEDIALHQIMNRAV